MKGNETSVSPPAAEDGQSDDIAGVTRSCTKGNIAPSLSRRRIRAIAEFPGWLLDIGLPGMDGFEVARQIRALPSLARVLLLAMTGYASAEDRAQAKAAGFDEHLVKPVDLDRLRELLARAR